MKKGRKVVGFTILSILIAFSIGIVIMLPSIAEKMKETQREEVLDDMRNIYTSAIIVDEIDVGLHEDVDEKGKFIKLSEMSGFRVYNKVQDKKYSVSKDYKTGDISVHYGKDIQFPELEEIEEIPINEEDISVEDLFTYDETTSIIVTGFSEAGVSLLESDSVIQIPETYKGRDVTKIAEKAFYNRNITGTVIIPSNIKSIGKNAFSNNGARGASDSIKKPGKWMIEDKEWIEVE